MRRLWNDPAWRAEFDRGAREMLASLPLIAPSAGTLHTVARTAEFKSRRTPRSFTSDVRAASSLHLALRSHDRRRVRSLRRSHHPFALLSLRSIEAAEPVALPAISLRTTCSICRR